LPELPEVETTKRGIAHHIVGKSLNRIILRNRQLRWPVPDDISTLEKQTLLNVSRRGKYLLMQFAKGTAIWHLGMSGSLRLVTRETPPGKHDHVDWVFDDGTTLRFNDPRRFGVLLWTQDNPETHFLLAHLGPEPLSTDFDGEYLYRQTRKSRQGIKSWLMNAQNVVGVGNIYANESLFASGIHPLKAALRLSRPRCERLAEEVKNILSLAIEQGGTTLRDFVGGDGKPGYFAQELNVYGRGGQDCKKCGKSLTEKRINQRTTVYCTQCQT
jgi:formamidopyrimidine-DNA glycosylase